MMQDGKEMTKFLLDYLNKEKLTLLGHSWGSLYGANLALEYPEYYEAFIGVGQFIDPLENEQRLYNAALEWSVGDEEGQTVLSGWSPNNEDSVEALQARNATLERYGYGMMKDGTDYNIFTTVLFNPNYTIKDYIGYMTNGSREFEPYLAFWAKGEMSKLSLLGKYDYKVPYYNINGDMDYQTNYQLACEYFGKVNAPEKAMIVMENATHGLLEGNYLLLDTKGWSDLSSFADYTISLSSNEALLRNRLIERRIACGHPKEESADFVDFSDMANVRLCLEHSKKADLMLRWQSLIPVLPENQDFLPPLQGHPLFRPRISDRKS